MITRTHSSELSRFTSSIVFLAAWHIAAPWTCTFAQEEKYPDHPDAVAKDGVPQGEVVGPISWSSKIYPGTVRDYYVYVPKQYDAAKPACLVIVQDGMNRAREWRLPVVMDNLIHDHSMPVTIGIFIDPGVVPAANSNSQPRFNRSFEYDGLGDRYARFLIDEILPEVSKNYNLSIDPNDRAIAGASSGAVCAFNAAWERPDQFRRVLSTIGTYVGLRGGNEFPVLVRKTEPKPIRIFLQDGSNDLDIYSGSWWMANQDMLASFTYAGYEVEHVWGSGGHNGKHAAAIMPDAMRWLWKDYPSPVKAKMHSRGRVKVLTENDGWELVSEGHKFVEGPAAGLTGEAYFVDVATDEIFKIDADGKVAVFASGNGKVSGLMLGPDKMLYACASEAKQIVRFDSSGKKETLIADATCNDLVVTKRGLYYTDPRNKAIWFSDFQGAKKKVDEGIAFPNGLICSMDQTLLHVADTEGPFTYSYQILENGDLAHKQTFGYLHCPNGASRCHADGMTMDNQGNLYVATNIGVQVLDQLGRVNLIINKPHTASISNVAFIGDKRDTLLITCGDKVFRRKTQATGNFSWEDPMTPPKPGL